MIEDVAYVHYRVSSLQETTEFLRDFGLLEVGQVGTRRYWKGRGSYPFCYVAEEGEPSFAGIGFRAESVEALKVLSEREGVPVVDSNAPGGHKSIQLVDPDGWEIEILAGGTPTAAVPVARDPMTINYGVTKNRIDAYQRLRIEPSEILRLGHLVLNVTDITTSLPWYQEKLGLLVSHEIYDDIHDRPFGAFCRLNRGETPVDHHSLGLFGIGKKGIHHASFEVQDFDSVQTGHYALDNKGWKHQFGIGRHVIGSQVFDYWRDPDGFRVEHFCDGDMLTSAPQPHRTNLTSPEAVHQWGPEVPQDFFDKG